MSRGLERTREPGQAAATGRVRAAPAVELQDGARRQDMIAREVTGQDRAQWWARAVAAYPPYADYQKRTTREIPVFVLEPAD